MSDPNMNGDQSNRPQYGAYDSNHGGAYPPQNSQDRQSQSGQSGQQNYYGPYAANPNPNAANGNPYGTPYGAPNARQPQQEGSGQQGWYGFSYQPGQPGGMPNANFNIFRLFEEWLPDKAKTKIRVIYGVVGLAAIALGLALLLTPNKTLALVALLLGVYFVISGVVRIVTSLVEPGLPAGWRVLDVIVGILLAFGGVVVVRNYGLTGQTLAMMVTMMVGFGWTIEGVMSLVESWRMPHSGWAIAYAVISIIAGMVVVLSPLSSTVFLVIFGGCAMVAMGVMAMVRAFTFGKPRK